MSLGAESVRRPIGLPQSPNTRWRGPMNFATANDRDGFLEDLAAELTNVAYPVALRHGVGERWLDLELELWKAVSESLRNMDRDSLHSLSNSSNPPKVSEFF